MEGIRISHGDQDILILDEDQPVDDSVVLRRTESSPTRADTAGSAGVSLCECLKNAREVRQLDVKTVAENLKIKPEQVEALEAGNLDAFPRFYALGFLRTYAAYLGEEALGFSAEEAVAQFKEERQHFKKDQTFNFPVAITEARLPQAPVIAASGLAAAVIYGFWIMLAGPSYDAANAVPQVPANMTEVIVEPPARETVAAVVDDDALGEARDEPEIAVATVDVVPVSETIASEADGRSDRLATVGQGPSVAFRATQDAWVRIVRAGEAPIIEGVLHAGESVSAPAHGEVEIKTANPGALELLVDGELVGSVGGDDEVHQLISLDLGRLVKQAVHAN